MRRLAFFGRPAQKFRLVMRERQVRGSYAVGNSAGTGGFRLVMRERQVWDLMVGNLFRPLW